MGLILVKEMPKAKKEYTRDELCVGFDRFNKLSKKLHKLHSDGLPVELSVDSNRYVERRDAYKKRNCTHNTDDA